VSIDKYKVGRPMPVLCPKNILGKKVLRMCFVVMFLLYENVKDIVPSDWTTKHLGHLNPFSLRTENTRSLPTSGRWQTPLSTSSICSLTVEIQALGPKEEPL
jgi:hypothetical protein